jgi:hypothetical protein
MTFLKNAARAWSYRNTIVACELLLFHVNDGPLDNKDIFDRLCVTILIIGEIIII